jgi:ethanolamine permease
MVIGIVALLTGKTAEIITLSVFGALTLYILSMITVLRLRRQEPHLIRPFKVPLYPVVPVLALLISSGSLIAMTVFNGRLALIYFLILAGSYGVFKMFSKEGKQAVSDVPV